MSQKLTRLVEASDDPNVLMYVINNLGVGVPSNACFAPTVLRLKGKAVQALVTGEWKINRMRKQQLAPLQRAQRDLLEEQLMPALLDLRERKLANLLFQQSSMNVFVGKLSKENPDQLRKELASEDPLVRLLVILTIGRRHLHMEKELIECLNDPYPPIRGIAHEVLVRIARATDFGPIPGSSQTGVTRSIEKWRHWLALQHGYSPDTTVAGEAIAVAGKENKVDPAKAVHLVLDHGNRELQTVSSEATHLCDELVKAKGDEQMSVLARLRDAKGIDNTDALALAIPKLSMGAAQREARDALARRLTRMTAATLRDKLQEDAVEVRRAAALACGRKKATEHIPDLLQLLDDPEVAVIQAARTALKELTGEDFGPDVEAGRRGRASAAAAWRKWWKEHTSEPK